MLETKHWCLDVLTARRYLLYPFLGVQFHLQSGHNFGVGAVISQVLLFTILVLPIGPSTSYREVGDSQNQWRYQPPAQSTTVRLLSWSPE